MGEVAKAWIQTMKMLNVWVQDFVSEKELHTGIIDFSYTWCFPFPTETILPTRFLTYE